MRGFHQPYRVPRIAPLMFRNLPFGECESPPRDALAEQVAPPDHATRGICLISYSVAASKRAMIVAVGR